MTLGELIEILQKADPDHVCKVGFGAPMSYRGYYDELAFEPAENVTVASMLKNARSALGGTFIGYKGGEFLMSEHTDCWLAHYGHTGETLGPALMRFMLGGGA